jgi:hypothetical protein
MSSSFVELDPFEGQELAMASRPGQSFGDLRRSRFARDHSQIRDSHQHLKIRANNMKVRRAVIVRIRPDSYGAEALKDGA